MLYSSDYSPQSLAMGDFNNDNLMDITTANYNNDNIDIYFGYGNGTFYLNNITLETGSQTKPYAIAVGMFNNDTFLDIIVVNYGSNNVGIFLGYGDGSFMDMKVFAIGYGSLPFSILPGHFNNDQMLDFVVANEGTDNLKIFLQTC
ncbi:unnamed protein product [Adineta ricciae]|uniref:VCBS repeat-containing protein n=2 Tax=Adineta ricciae TaxID=249248 RepID=A0A815EEI8_ADIRI|nr:unnamed protein product [Adineta ricciae]